MVALLVLRAVGFCVYFGGVRDSSVGGGRCWRLYTPAPGFFCLHSLLYGLVNVPLFLLRLLASCLLAVCACWLVLFCLFCFVCFACLLCMPAFACLLELCGLRICLFATFTAYSAPYVLCLPACDSTDLFNCIIYCLLICR